MQTDNYVVHKVLRALALAVGGVASLIGAFGVVIVVAGNDFIGGGLITASLIGLTVLAIVGAVLVWWQPVTAAVALFVAAVGYVYSLWADLDGWWSAYQDAVGTSGAAENAFWLDQGGAAMALFLISAALLVLAAVLAAFGHVRRAVGQRPATTA